MSDMTLFPHGIYLEIKSLRLDLHLKRKQRKPQRQQQKKTTTTTAIPKNMCSSEKKEKKKKPRNKNRGCSERTQVVRCYLGRARRPGSRGGLDLARLDR